VSSGEHLETERKYTVGPDFVLPDFTGLPGVAAVSPPRRQRLTATYFDTAGLRLAAARITLRRRTGGQDAGWHLKLPESGDTRREVRLPAGPPGQPVPVRLAEMVSPWTGGEELAPVARLQTTRIVRHLLGDGEDLAEVADDRVNASRAATPAPQPGTGLQVHWQEPLSWREIEVELVAGDQELLAAAGQRLTDAGAAPASSASKLHRLLGTQPATGR
jgi:inorganic triphosphatase YgiF